MRVLQDTMTDGPVDAPLRADARAGVKAGGSTFGEDGAGGGGGGRPSARWSIPAAPGPGDGTAVKMGRREAWARFLAYEVRGPCSWASRRCPTPQIR